MGFLAIILAIAIIGLLYYLTVLNGKKQQNASQKTFFQEAGVDTSSYKGTLDSAKKIIKSAEASRSSTPY